MDSNKKKNGQTKYKLQTILNNLDVVKKLKGQGATNDMIAAHFNVARSTFYNYINQSPELKNALEDGTVDLVNDLVGILVNKAKPHTLQTSKTIEKDGHITTEVVVKETDGDLGALIFLLKNLSDKWVDNPQML